MSDCRHGGRDVADRAEMYRRQLGGTQAALRREQQRVRDLEAEIARMRKEAGR